MKKCPYCRKENQDDAFACKYCGRAIIHDASITNRRHKKCPYCAEEILDEAIVCRYCGRDLIIKDKPVETVTLKKKSNSKGKIMSVRQVWLNALIMGVSITFFLAIYEYNNSFGMLEMEGHAVFNIVFFTLAALAFFAFQRYRQLKKRQQVIKREENKAATNDKERKHL